jgi:hypothetical protein
MNDNRQEMESPESGTIWHSAVKGSFLPRKSTNMVNVAVSPGASSLVLMVALLQEHDVIMLSIFSGRELAFRRRKA